MHPLFSRVAWLLRVQPLGRLALVLLSLCGVLLLMGVSAWLGATCSLAPLAAGPQFAADPRPAPVLPVTVAAAFDEYAARAEAAPYHHISLCSYPHPKFALLQRTAAWHGDTVTALGMGDVRFQRWGVGFGVKLEQVQRWLAEGPAAPDDIVLFSDAFDVMLMAGSAEVKRAYVGALRRAMAEEVDPAAVASGRPPRVPTLLFSTERYCWPDAERAGAYPASDRKFEFAFLNSGTYIGRAGDLAASMARLNYTIAEDDQRYWTSLYLASRDDYSAPRIVLDHSADVFLCMSGYSLGEDVGWDPATRRYRSRRSPGVSVVMHFNGGKTEVGDFYQALAGTYCPDLGARRANCRAAAATMPAVAAFVLGLALARGLHHLVASAARGLLSRRRDYQGGAEVSQPGAGGRGDASKAGDS